MRALTRLGIGLSLFSIIGLNGGGCVIDLSPGGGGSDGKITIVIRNATNTDLDPEIYLSDVALSSDELLQDENKYTLFGVQSRGVLGPQDDETIELDCAEVRVVGTAGGIFGDDFTDPEGTGNQRLLSQSASFDCGEVITFTFSRSGSGFSTSVDVQ